MIDGRAVLEAFCGVNLGFTATLIYGVYRLSRRLSRRAALPNDAPPLCILRPCEGDEPGLYENLLSSRTAAYSGPRRVLLLVPDPGDPAYAVARAVAAALPEVEVLVTAPRPLENRKVAQLIVGFRASAEEIVVCADSDVRLADGDLEALIAALLDEGAQPTAAAAFAVPIEVASRTRWDRASAAVVGGSPQSFLALYGMSALFGIAPSMAGALCAFRRSALQAVGGLASVRDCLGEDNELARQLIAAGHGVALSQKPARCWDGGRAAAATIGRVARWLQVVRAQRPLLLPSYPLLVAATPLLMVLSLFARDPILVGLFAVLLLLRMWLSRVLRRFCRLPSGFFTALGDVFLGEGLLWLGFCRALFSRRIRWRGHPFIVDKGGRLRPIAPPP